MCRAKGTLTNSLSTHRLWFTSPHFSSSSSSLNSWCFLRVAIYKCVRLRIHRWVHNTIDELLCAWVRYRLRFRVCLCQVYVRHKSARFYTLRFLLLLLRCLLLLLYLVLFCASLLSASHSFHLFHFIIIYDVLVRAFPFSFLLCVWVGLLFFFCSPPSNPFVRMQHMYVVLERRKVWV